MKKITTLLAFSLLSTLILAQQESDTTKFKYKGKVITITSDTSYTKVSSNKDEDNDEKEKEYEYWRGLEFGFAGYFTDNEFGYNNDPANKYMELDFGRSYTINLNIAEFNKGIIGEKVRFITGLGFRFNRYAFKNSTYSLTQNEDGVFGVNDSLRDYYKNYLNTSYVTVPVYFSLVPGKNPENSFHLSLGVVGSARIGSRLKQRFVLDGKKEKEITRETFHLNPFMLDYSVRFGYGDFTAFANYSATQLFEKDKGPEYYPFSFGVSWNF